jgi:hypothetical protein
MATSLIDKMWYCAAVLPQTFAYPSRYQELGNLPRFKLLCLQQPNGPETAQ